MHFNEWVELNEAKKKKHKKHKHPYYCPGCGYSVFVRPSFGRLVYNDHDHSAHHCPTTNAGVPGEVTSDAPAGTVAATAGAASAASAAVGDGGSAAGDGGGASGGGE